MVNDEVSYDYTSMLEVLDALTSPGDQLIRLREYKPRTGYTSHTDDDM